MKPRTKKVISYFLTAIVIAGAVWLLLAKFWHPGRVEFTDNATVSRHIVPVNSRVQGYIKEIRFDEYQPVHKGDTLVIIDDTDLRLVLARAEADLAAARAGQAVAGQSVTVASANSAVSDAAIEEARVLMENARTDLDRFERLLAADAVTQREYDGAKTDFEARRATYERLVRQRSAANTVVGESRSRTAQAEAAVMLAETQVATARQNLAYTVVLAPCDGYTSRRQIQVGQLVQPGQTLLDVVDTSDTWVTANYRETQTANIHPGSPVRITVDALDGAVLRGTVRSLSTATGASLSLLPQDNSAGNFVKVRQRIPVRIEFDADNDTALLNRLSAGMNVECEVSY